MLPLTRAEEAGRQDVGEEDRDVIVDRVGQRIAGVVGHRHAHRFGLLAAQPSELAGGTRAVAEYGRAAFRALRRLSAPTEEASPACDQARDDDALSLLQAIDARADFLDHADALMTEHEAGHDGQSAVIEVQVGAADAGARDSHERVGGRLERGVVDALDAHVVGSVEDSSFHL